MELYYFKLINFHHSSNGSTCKLVKFKPVKILESCNQRRIEDFSLGGADPVCANVRRWCISAKMYVSMKELAPVHLLRSANTVLQFCF